MTTPRVLAAASILLAVAAGCDGGGSRATGDSGLPADGPRDAGVAVVEEVWETARDTLDNVDSPSVWHGPDGEHWVLVTAKEGDAIGVSDARTGAFVRRVGSSGAGAGQLERPNGIAVARDLAFVVERDNRRVQAFRLPAFTSLGTFGEDRLKRPYGVAVRADADGRYTLWVTDAWETLEETVPPAGELGERVHAFAVSEGSGGLEAEHVGAFGDTTGPAVLRVVESIAVDAARDRLLIAEEQEGRSGIHVYTTGGDYSGLSIDPSYFPHQAEGIALYACPDGGGYWLTTDQDPAASTFHVFDRRTLDPTGSFRGRRVRNTDGIAVTARDFAGFPGGAFFAVHDDGSTVAFRWADIAAALGLRSRCAGARPSS